MRIDHLAVLLALVVVANLALLGALFLPRLVSRRNGALSVGALFLDAAPANLAPTAAGGPGAYEGGLFESGFYERVVRVVTYVFIAAGLLVVTLGQTADQSLIYLLLALGAFLIVLGQDIVPLALLGRWRYPLEALTAILFVSLLVYLGGGYASPFFLGYVLLLSGASLWARGAMPFVLALLTSVAYLLAVSLAPEVQPIDLPAVGVIAFNLVIISLIAYVAAVIGGEQRRAREAALRLSRFDVLTGLHNRGYFDAAVEREIVRAQRANRPFSLLMIDVDGLKAANDRYGHAVGDRLLRAAAEAIRAGVRASDFAARYGGDEFVVVLPDTDQAGALRVGEKLRFDISRLALRQDTELVQTSVSIGLVTFPEDGRTSDELMRRVDLAMYEAKRRGKNQLVRFARQSEALAGTPLGGPIEGEEPARSPAGQRAGTIPIERPTAGGTEQVPPWEKPRG
ncbi:MAG TPA: GGDEF domain-containing protein [Candidatus Limnocylindria bacterium]|nr:GGDEF domain-containing protein [Candidatus Limnocylindria bacterium]